MLLHALLIVASIKKMTYLNLRCTTILMGQTFVRGTSDTFAAQVRV